ncbi:hypothetical protein HanPI659440_Chr17g0702921 [Helianthus annuus]|nr:hypothetical protein HanPI659440_Chr17g0702921 [Helianthus annuus]
MGNRFGFVSLLDVKDTSEMERKLSDIRMGEYKLFFNVARFTLEDGEINNRQSERIKPKIAKAMSGGVTTGKEVNGGTYVGVRTFKDVMLGGSSESKEEKTIIIQDNFKLPELGNGKDVIARMKDFKTLKEADEILKGMMERAGMVQYVGGMVIMVSFKFDEEVERFLALSKEKGETFQSVEKWVGQSLPFERIAWLRVLDIPLHLLDNVVIDRIEERFGRVVQGGFHDVLDADMSFDYVGVLVSEGKRIQEEVVVQWKGRRYRVWAAEEVADWIPDFVSKNRGLSDKEAPAGWNGSPITDEEVPVNRSLVQRPEISVRPSASGILESPTFTYTSKEGGMHGQSMIGDHIEVFINVEESEGVGMEGGVIFGEIFLGSNNVERESRPHVLKGSSNSINKTGRRVGQIQPKLLSVDNRPSSRKRARLD